MLHAQLTQKQNKQQRGHGTMIDFKSVWQDTGMATGRAREVDGIGRMGQGRGLASQVGRQSVNTTQRF